MTYRGCTIQAGHDDDGCLWLAYDGKSGDYLGCAETRDGIKRVIDRYLRAKR